MTAQMKAGLFVLVSLASLSYMMVRITQTRYSYVGTKKYYAHVHDATGLLPKTKIKMAGLDVGHLENIELAGKQAKVTMQIAADLLLHRDATVTIRAIGFLGDKYIELYPGSEATPVLVEGEMVAESLSSGGLEGLTAKTTEVLENLKEITQVLKEALKGSGEDGEDSRLDRILDNMEQFTEALASLDKVEDLLDEATEIATNIRDVTEKVKRGEGTIGKLLTESEIADKLNSTLSGVNKVLTKADKLVIGVDAHTGLLVSTGGAKSAFSVMFQPTYDKYYLVGITASPRGLTTRKRTVTTTNGSGTLTEDEDETIFTSIGISAQFAKRFGDTTFKVGLFESTGGLGADYDLITDRAKLFTELYRFQSGAKPQWNIGTELHVYRPFYIWLGGEDVLTQTRRNVFAGGGIRFTDQDIKSLVTAAVVGR